MKKISITTILFSLSLLSGCASIVSDNTYPVALSSEPGGADFVVLDRNGEEVHAGRTPSTVTLNSGAGYFKPASYTVRFTKAGYENKELVFRSDIDGWYFGNIMLGGVIGMVFVDPATGAMWRLPQTQTVRLDEDMAGIDTDNGLTVVSIDQVPASQRDSLIPIR